MEGDKEERNLHEDTVDDVQLYVRRLERHKMHDSIVSSSIFCSNDASLFHTSLGGLDSICERNETSPVSGRFIQSLYET